MNQLLTRMTTSTKAKLKKSGDQTCEQKKQESFYVPQNDKKKYLKQPIYFIGM